MKFATEFVRALLHFHAVSVETELVRELELVPLILSTRHPVIPEPLDRAARRVAPGSRGGWSTGERVAYRQLKVTCDKRFADVGDAFVDLFIASTTRLLSIYCTKAAETNTVAERERILKSRTLYDVFTAAANELSVWGPDFVGILMRRASVDCEMAEWSELEAFQSTRLKCLVALAYNAFDGLPMETLQRLMQLSADGYPRSVANLEKRIMRESSSHGDCAFLLIGAILTADVHVQRQGPVADLYLQRCHARHFPTEMQSLRTIGSFREYVLQWPYSPSSL